MNIVYFGTSKFASMLLRRLAAAGKVPALVVTTSDARGGRGLQPKASAVKLLARKSGYRCVAPDDLTGADAGEEIKKYRPEIFIIASYGKRIPPEVLAIPEKFPLGVHPSLLPDLRGAAPIQRALMRGDEETGVTVFVVAEKIDSGPVFIRKKLRIDPQDDYDSLSERLVDTAFEAVIKTLAAIEAGTYTLTPQDEGAVTYAAKLKKSDGKIHWDRPAESIVNLIRATKGWPSAFTSFGGRQIKILKAGAGEEKVSGTPGTIVSIDNEGICVITKDRLLKIYSVCPQGKKEMPAKSFVNGYRVKVGDKFE